MSPPVPGPGDCGRQYARREQLVRHMHHGEEGRDTPDPSRRSRWWTVRRELLRVDDSHADGRPQPAMTPLRPVEAARCIEPRIAEAADGDTYQMRKHFEPRDYGDATLDAKRSVVPASSFAESAES